LVANLGTEHRASASTLRYHAEAARQINKITGKKLVLHGTSSVGNDQLKNLFADGIAKVNIWTILERNSAPVLFENMVRDASKIVGPEKTAAMIQSGLLGKKVQKRGKPSLSHYTTAYRQGIIFIEIKKIALTYLRLWYV
jgi:fructose/tagatose bisphosphate aldolase